MVYDPRYQDDPELAEWGTGGPVIPKPVTNSTSGGDSSWVWESDSGYNRETGSMESRNTNPTTDEQIFGPNGEIGGSTTGTSSTITDTNYFNGDNLKKWGSEFDNLPQTDPEINPNLDISKLSGQDALASPSTSSVSGSSSTSSPYAPASTRPYIWKYQ